MQDLTNHEDKEWYKIDVGKIFKIFGSTEKGLTKNGFENNLKKFGLNTLNNDKPISYLRIFFRQFKSPLIYVLIGASFIVLIMGDYVDFAIITFIILVNAVIGTFQEGKAENTLLALKRVVKGYANVLRDGVAIVIDDTEIVPGDVLILKDGSQIPADARIIEANQLKVNESSLTGESESVMKTEGSLAGTNIGVSDQKNMLFRGTYVVSGIGKAVVVTTGTETVIGKIAKQLTEIKMEVPLQKNIQNLSRFILVTVFILITVLFFVGINTGKSLSEMFLIVVAISVSSIPAGLPVVVTLVLATGVWRMSKIKVLVKRLQAVEALGQANVLALDKTGTITKNQMMVAKIYTNHRFFDITGSGYFPNGEIFENDKKVNHEDQDLHLAGMISTLTSIAEFKREKDDWSLISGDPTEAALLVFGQKLGLNKKELLYKHPKILEIPFDFETKHHSVLHEIDGKKTLMTAGSPEVVLSFCDHIWRNGRSVKLTEVEKKELHNVIDLLSSDGYRVLALAVEFNSSGDVDAGNMPKMTFVGYAGILDAIRENVFESLKKVQDANMKVVMITGDYPKTAESIAKKIGIFNQGDITLTGKEIEELSDEALVDKIDKVSVFARVSPQHKLKIIQAFKQRGFTIAMTGDGINDALSLTAADLGVSMGQAGTEVAREASDIILVDDNFGNIVQAAEEGRNIYKTIQKAVLYLLSTSLGEIIILSLAIFFSLPLPLVASQIIWLNFVTDAFMVAPLALDPKEKNLLKDKFNKPAKYIVDKLMTMRIILLSVTMASVSFLLYYTFLDENDLNKSWTITLTALAVFQWYNVFNVRSEKRSIFSRETFQNKYLLYSMCVAISLQIFAVYHPIMNTFLKTAPLNLNEWMIILMAGASIVLVEETRKIISNSLSNKKA